MVVVDVGGDGGGGGVKEEGERNEERAGERGREGDGGGLRVRRGWWKYFGDSVFQCTT